jgi:ferrous iron transport protein B
MSQPLATSASRKIFLVGNPNVGKSVLFNALTGAYTTVSNYPGTSVEISRGEATIAGSTYEILDTPGMYGLQPMTEEERVAQRILLQEEAFAVIHVIDARNLERMLPMTVQLIEAGLPLILVVNIIDEAERMGIAIDIELLRQRLDIPVIAAATAHKRGLDEIRAAIAAFSGSRHPAFAYAADLEREILRLSVQLHGDYRVDRRALALLFLLRDEEATALVNRVEGDHAAAIAATGKEIIFSHRSDLHLRLSMERKRICAELLAGVVSTSPRQGRTVGERLSVWTMNPWTGVPILLAVLYFGLYQFVGIFGAGTIVGFLEGDLFAGIINPWFIATAHHFIPWTWLNELLVGEYGILTLAVRYAVALVMPIVGTFFVAFSILEDSGYFPRLAMLVDRVFKAIGLNGRAVIPMVLGFGCDTMATMVTRTLETTRERVIATVLLALAIPCSAQLGVILALLAGVPGTLLVWTVVMSLIFLVVGFLSAKIMPGERPMFYMEIPPLRLPQLTNVVVKTLTRMQWYFIEIFPLFIFASLVLWAGKMTGGLAALVRVLAPGMTMLGLPQEVAAVFVFGFFRRDFGAAGLYDMNAQGLLSPVQLTVAAVTLTLFVPCVAQFLMMKKERGWKTALIIFALVTVTAFSVGWLLNRLLLTSGWLA